jgi:hypothetical protein
MKLCEREVAGGSIRRPMKGIPQTRFATHSAVVESSKSRRTCNAAQRNLELKKIDSNRGMSSLTASCSTLWGIVAICKLKVKPNYRRRLPDLDHSKFAVSTASAHLVRAASNL